MFLRSLGGFGLKRRSETCGSTAFMIMKHRPGCVALPVKAVSDQWLALHTQICVTLTALCDWIFYTCLKLCHPLASVSPRLAAVGPGADDPLSGLLLHLLPGVPGSAGHPDQGRTLLLHWPLPGLCRCRPQTHPPHNQLHMSIHVQNTAIKMTNMYFQICNSAKLNFESKKQLMVFDVFWISG